jgi:hypothetical protein
MNDLEVVNPAKPGTRMLSVIDSCRPRPSFLLPGESYFIPFLTGLGCEVRR